MGVYCPCFPFFLWVKQPVFPLYHFHFLKCSLLYDMFVIFISISKRILYLHIVQFEKLILPTLDEKLCHSMLVMEGIHWLSPRNNHLRRNDWQKCSYQSRTSALLLAIGPSEQTANKIGFSNKFLQDHTAQHHRVMVSNLCYHIYEFITLIKCQISKQWAMTGQPAGISLCRSLNKGMFKLYTTNNLRPEN